MSSLNQFRPIEINLYQQRTREFRGPNGKFLVIGSVYTVLFLALIVWANIIQSNIEDYDLKISDEQSKMTTYQNQLQQMNAGGRLDVWADLPNAIRRSHLEPLQLMKDFAKFLPEDTSVTEWMIDETNILRCKIDFGSTESFTNFKATIDHDAEFHIVRMDTFMNKPVIDVQGAMPSTAYVPVTTIQFDFQVTPPIVDEQQGGQP